MPRVILEMSMSLDGYTAGSDVGPDLPLGRGGEALHDWMFAERSQAEIERLQREKFAGIGSVIVGRRMADLGIRYWGDEPAFHAPVFVVTHRPAETIVRRGGTSYVFVSEGLEIATARAREAAAEGDVMIGGGADIARQLLATGVVDELRLHIAPVALGRGTPLFDDQLLRAVRLRPIDATTEPLATHITYEVSPAG
jgi:dihydrofolate reductase